MAYNDQNTNGLPLPGNNQRKTADLLPRFFRTEANKKFLQGTLDQLVQPGVAEKINSYYGRKTAKAFDPSDNYFEDFSDQRQHYQLEPAVVIKDDNGNATFYKDYNDYINQLGVFGANTDNHSRLNTQETYAWNPNIVWDKFVNFREYYWLPTGPNAVPVRGQTEEVTSTYTVTLEDQGDNFSFVFNNGLERNPTIKLYRGQKYRFEIDTPGHPFSIAITRSFVPGSAVIVAGSEGLRSDGLFDAQLYGNEYDMGDYLILPSSGSVTFEADENVSTLYPDGIRRLGEEGEEIANVYVEKGVIEFIVPANSPDRLYYISKTAVDTSGQIRIADIEENTSINVEEEIIGKKSYLSANSVEFTNGLKVYFQGNVSPKKYANDAWYVEGVGDNIVLVNENDLIIPSAYSENNLLPFDSEDFDTLPFANATSYPGTKDYLVINRGSRDRNAWTRFNRWFHREVIEKSFEYNQLPINLDESLRAKRPIIEFEAGLKLFSFGTEAKADIDLIDTFTTDVFSTVEGSIGYYVDGVELAPGMRVLFANDSDILVNGKIYEVKFIKIGNDTQISLIEAEDTVPLENETVFVKLGSNAGKTYYYNGQTWKLGQEKTKTNQPPLFDLCCPIGNEYGDSTIFNSTTFTGTKIFSYKEGEGTNDSELGFPLDYRNIENSGDILFEFNLLTDTFDIQTDTGTEQIKTDTANLRKYKSRDSFSYVNGWSKTPTQSVQKVLRQYIANEDLLNNFEIDVYDKAGTLTDLKVNVFVNNKLQGINSYSILRQNNKAFVVFNNPINTDDVVLIKTNSSTAKNSNGWYEFPFNLERNPDNLDISEFTLGEVLDHVDTMIEDIQNVFVGVYPGVSNLRDLGSLDVYGKKFLKHSGPINLPLYHITNKTNNLVKALDYSNKEYTTFKKNFLLAAENLGFDGPIVQHVDKVIETINQDKVKTQPFYFSDMLGTNFSKKIEYTIVDPSSPFYSINRNYSINELSNQSFLVYLNGNQLIHGRDYSFNNEGFILITTSKKKIGDIIEIYEYENTDGSYVAPTPSKLGLYPKYIPEIVLDDTIIASDTTQAVFYFDDNYVSKSLTGINFEFEIKINKDLNNYNVTIINPGKNWKINDIIVVSGESLSGFTPINDCKIKVTKIGLNGEIQDIEITGTSTANESIGPYKLYGQVNEFDVGWFYPIFTRKKDAENIDSNNSATKILFNGSNKIFYVPTNLGTFAGEDDITYDEYPFAETFIQGHDGSFVKAFKDYRDNLLIEFEKRIYNNIKIDYEGGNFDINDLLPSRFRNTEFTLEDINSTLIRDFAVWTKNIDQNYTANYFYDINNRLTLNYASTTSPVDGELNKGFWRGIYLEHFDTDRPHTHPWEMLGFTIKPEWWNTTYGPAPYTSNNLILWEDLEQGIVREPNKPVQIRQKYVRPGLTNFIPTDELGNLKSPLLAGVTKSFSLRNTGNNFVFGDGAPVETSWRRSSQYPFSIIKAYLLNKPADALAKGFDVSRISKNLAGQFIYSETGKNIRLEDLLLPNTYQDDQRIITSGYVNYIYNLLASNILATYDDYRNDLKNVKNNLGVKLAGFSDKAKLKIVLDSRSPNTSNQNQIYIPEENYNIFINTSSPLEIVNYSGVIIEKQSDGFVVSGYNFKKPYFEYTPIIALEKDITITVGGISENTVDFKSGKIYAKGQIIEFNGAFYRVTENFTATDQFSADNLAPIDQLPIVGGQAAKIRKTFNNNKKLRLNYGTKLKSIQEVVDFILGYENNLKTQGFDFNFYNETTSRVENWTNSVREFLFWTTQEWASGTTLTLSAGAYRIDYNTDYAIIDDIFDNFYDYSLLKTNGSYLERKFSSVVRDENNFGLLSRQTDEGIYNINLPLVQKEHVLLIDNSTVFNDIIYQPSTGYRQERLKLLGYKNADWNGGLNIPGFVYDDAKVTTWESWKDYKIGSLVKYKQFYYVALSNITGKQKFEENRWFKLNEKPESDLITNFDYRINQFADFYDLDTDNFDSETQRLAQHLIGYQKRDYLANIIQDDVSQYKFYQGFIQDKGTKNALDKLFNNLGAAGQNSLEYYEQWALQVGRYGSTESVEQVEFVIDETRIQESPQSFELVENDPVENFDRIYRIKPYEVYDKPENYDHNPFPTTNEKEYILSGGYVHEDDIVAKVGNLSQLNSFDTNTIKYQDYIWVSSIDPYEWDVYQYVRTGLVCNRFSSIDQIDEDGNNLYILQTTSYTKNLISVGEVVGLRGAQEYNIIGLYEVVEVGPTFIIIKVTPNIRFNDLGIAEQVEFNITKLKSVRVNNIADANTVVEDKFFDNQKLWIDNYEDNNWSVIENTNVYSQIETLTNPVEFDSTFHEFSHSMDVTQNNRNLFVSSPGNDNGSVYYYKRTKDNSPWVEQAVFYPEQDDLYNAAQARFGNSISVSEDGEYLAVGSPLMNEVKTRYKGVFNPELTYNKNDIVKYRESLWQVIRQILPQTDEQPYSTFETYTNIVSDESADSSTINLLVAGNSNLPNSIVSDNEGNGHLLVRAPVDMYIGSEKGYTVKLFWNLQSFANDNATGDITELETFEPFNGQIPNIDENFIIDEHEIIEKIDNIIYLETYVSLPEVGDRIQNDVASGEVAYVAVEGDDAVIYVKNVKGILSISDEIFRIDPQTNDEQFIGFYDQSLTFNLSDNLAGFWMIPTPAYNNNGIYTDTGRGLVYVDLVSPDTTRDLLDYYNIQNAVSEIGPFVTNNLRASFIKNLSFFGDLNDNEQAYSTNLFVVKAPKDFSDDLTALPSGGVGETRLFNLYDLDNRQIDFTDTGLSYNILNKQQTVVDVWDGYIDFTFVPFATTGEVFEPKPRYDWNGSEFVDSGPGDIIEDIQTPFDEFGGFAVTTETTSSAEVMFVQRNFNSVRIYIKILTGTWDLAGTNIAKFELRRTSRFTGDPSRLMGIIESYNNDIILEKDPIGKLIVFRADSQFDPQTRTWEEVLPITEEEYWFYQEINNQSGISREPNPPFKANKDYRQVYNIKANKFGEAGSARMGAVSVYRRTSGGRYELQDVLVSENSYSVNGNALSDRGFGHKVKITKNNDLYTLMVSSYIEDSPSDSPGTIEFFYAGSRDQSKYQGNWTRDFTYDRLDIVKYRGRYYQALKNIENQNDFTIFDTTSWEDITWRQGKDANYRGEWDNKYSYNLDSIVSKDGNLYKALTNINASAEFSTSAWEIINLPIDYLGYIPNQTKTTFNSMLADVDIDIETVFDPLRDLQKFALDFDVSDNGDVLIVKTKQEDSDSTSGQISVLVYRRYNEKYIFSQQIAEENKIDGFGQSIAINPKGNIIAISEPFDDTRTTDGGIVKIYKQVNGVFGTPYQNNNEIFTEPTQTLYSPSNEIVEKFGMNLTFHGDNLAVSSLNGDLTIPTTFDTSLPSEVTTFDNGFTEFKNIKYDTGMVYIFEQINDTLLFSERLIYKTASNYFGENILAKENHIYVGMSREGNELFKGTFLDFRKERNLKAWNIKRQLEKPVDISKIKGAFLYNKRTQEIVTYLDFIDPIQGKIAGPAEQEITHKVPYDPARYNIGIESNSDIAWLDNHVGEIWWDVNSAKFTYPYQGTLQYQKDNWNELQEDNTVDVFEWVESTLTPAEWNAVADTEKGLRQGISGQTLYNNRYSQKFEYDDISQTFSRKYYYWVTNKRTVPNLENRNLSTIDVINLIRSPQTQDYKFLSLLGKNRFILYNCNDLIYDKDIVLNIQFLKDGYKEEQNYHNQYQLLSDGDENSQLHKDIERKWFHSLIGFDEQNRRVPASNLTVKQKYGIQNRPRQSMFVNRTEALKLLIERVNRVLEENLIVDEYDLTNLSSSEPQPKESSNLYDATVSTIDDLQFVSTDKIVQAQVTPTIINGRIVSLTITNSGRGYKTSPTGEIRGSGEGSEFTFILNELGQITDFNLIQSGFNYTEDTTIAVRRFSVLVESDSTVNGKWSIYQWNTDLREWQRTSVQDYNVNDYWEYIDWYDSEYNEFTQIDHYIDRSYELNFVDDRIGEVVKIQNIGSGGWLLLEKIANEESEDYTVNYKTIGRQNGTIKFLNSLYDSSKNNTGFDNKSFDSILFDNDPVSELRIILDTIKHDLFVKGLKVEYNKLFLASLRYIFTEQQNVDWAFKTSFIRVKHNLGELKTDITFNSDNLPSYEQYINEAKPYKTVLGEFVSSYEKVDPTNTVVSDFDLPPYYNNVTNSITPNSSKILDEVLFDFESNLLENPRRNWLDNYGYQLSEINIVDGGSGYLFKPIVKIDSEIGSGATAEAYIGYGKVTKIIVRTPGTGYITPPKITIEGPIDENGTPAKAVAAIGVGVVRTPTIKIKFDRINGQYYIAPNLDSGVHPLTTTEVFTGTNVNDKFDLEWPVDLDINNTVIYLDGIEALKSEYTLSNVENKDAGYTRFQGQINFKTVPSVDVNIEVIYRKNLSMMSAEDRIRFAYSPDVNMPGLNLNQLMDGIDYGGVEVKSFDFGSEAGWDTTGWYTDVWDQFDSNYEDYVFTFDGSTIAVTLEEPLENNIEYNVYYRSEGTLLGKEVRLDDPNYNTVNQTNPNAIMSTIIGDGTTDIIYLDEYGITVRDNDVLIIRKNTSDGAFKPDTSNYDTDIIGGDLAYTTARGVNAEDINVDGDGFVTPTTSGGPEELVPGQVLDTLDIQVYTKATGDQGTINSQSIRTDGITDTFDLGIVPSTKDAVIVKVDGTIIDDYEIDWNNNSITIGNLSSNQHLNIVILEGGAQNLVDFGTFQTDGSTIDYPLDIEYNENYQISLTVNGEITNSELVQINDNNTAIRFESILEDNLVVNYRIFDNNDIVNYSQVAKDKFVITDDSVKNNFLISEQPFYALPLENNVIVKVNNKILNSGYNTQFTITSLREREFAIENFQYPGGSLLATDIKVFVNGEEISTPVQWRFEIVSSTVVLSNDIGAEGDLVEIFVSSESEYQLNNNTLILAEDLSTGDELEIFSFSNHDLLDIEKQKYEIISREVLTNENVNYITFNRLLVGEVSLRKPIIDTQYAWVTLNGTLLTPSVDYIVTPTNKVRLLTQPDKNDVIEVIHFASQKSQKTFAYRQFKDILNRTHFKRIDAPATILTQDLNYYDLRIEVEDSSMLPDPDKANNIPGIIWIDGERIEYLVKEENMLRQIRRGTLGTGVKNSYTAGTDIFDQGKTKNIPYKDVTTAQTIVTDGQTTEYDLDFIANNTNEFDVFVAGRRLKKYDYQNFNPRIALDSPEGDETIAKEFTIENLTDQIGNVLSTKLILRDTPGKDQNILVVRKVGKTWTESGISLGETNTDIGYFLRS